MKKLFFILSLISMCVFADTEINQSFALGSSVSSQSFRYVADKFSKVHVSFSCSASLSSFQYNSFGYTSTDTERRIEIQIGDRFLELDYQNLSKSVEYDTYVNKGNSSFSCSSSCNQNYQDYGVQCTLTVTRISQCPNTDKCSKYTCQYCELELCAVHDAHYSLAVEHQENITSGQPQTTHVHCSNDSNLLSLWRDQIFGTCPDCHKSICKLCPHSCVDLSCPNGMYCEKETCPLCHAEYCKRHMLHVCSNMTESNTNIQDGNISVQTTVTGQAVVHVDIHNEGGGGSTGTNDNSDVVAKLEELKQYIGIDDNTLNNSINSVKSSVDSLNQNIHNDLSQMNNNLVTSISGMNTTLHNDIGLMSDSLETAINGMKTDVSTNINTVGNTINNSISGMNTTLNNGVSSINENLDDVKGAINSLKNGNGSLNMGSPSLKTVNSSFGEGVGEKVIDGNEFKTVEKVSCFTAFKNKFIPPSLSVESYDTTLNFDLPSIEGSRVYNVNLDLNDSKLNPLKMIVRSLCSVGLCALFAFGIMRMVRQY